MADSARMEAELRRLNPAAEIVEASYGEIDPALLLERPPRDPRELRIEENGHVGDIRPFCLLLDEPLDWTAFGIWLTMLLQARGADLLRVKGLLNVGGVGPLSLNGVQHVVHLPEHLDAWPDDDRRSRLVFIGRGLDRAAVERSLLAFDAATK
jgi:G3E family GTPase